MSLIMSLLALKPSRGCFLRDVRALMHVEKLRRFVDRVEEPDLQSLIVGAVSNIGFYLDPLLEPDRRLGGLGGRADILRLA